MRLLRRAEVEKKVGVGPATIYRWLSRPDNDFPRPIRVGVKAVRWRSDELDGWLESRERAGAAPERAAS